MNISRTSRNIGIGIMALLFIGCAPRYKFGKFENLTQEQRHLMDSVGKIVRHMEDFSSDLPRSHYYDTLNSLLAIEESAFHQKWDHVDTVGAYARFQASVCPQLADAIAVASKWYDDEVLVCRILKTPTGDYFYICPSTVILGTPSDAKGYLLFNNKLIKIAYQNRCVASKVLRVSNLKQDPYNKFKVFYEFAMITYDGDVDYYKILGKDSLEFIGRGFLDYKHNFQPSLPQVGATWNTVP